MAKQVGPVFFTGTIDGIIFYKLGDKYYSRSKGSYKSAKHMRRNPKFKRTMQRAHQFGDASKLTQEVYYRYLPKAIRKFGLFGKLTGLVNGWLQQGKTRKEATEALIAHCQILAAAPVTPAQPAPKIEPVAPIAKKSVQQPASSSIQKHKQARYLSKWKVKSNGRLHIPKDRTATCLPLVTPLACYLPPQTDLSPLFPAESTPTAHKPKGETRQRRRLG